MKFPKIFGVLLVAFACLLPMGCQTAKVTPNGVYQGDQFLYNVEKTILSAHNEFRNFLQWELNFRAVLPVEVSRAADVIRLNEKKWLDSANALHDAYVAAPTAANKDKLQVTFNLIDSALAEALKYQKANKKVAPGIITQ